MKPNTALNRAIEIAGGQAALAKLCGVKQQTVFCWLRKFGRVPAARVLQIEKIVNGVISRHDLRPDIYPRSD